MSTFKLPKRLPNVYAFVTDSAGASPFAVVLLKNGLVIYEEADGETIASFAVRDVSRRPGLQILSSPDYYKALTLTDRDWVFKPMDLKFAGVYSLSPRATETFLRTHKDKLVKTVVTPTTQVHIGTTKFLRSVSSPALLTLDEVAMEKAG
jgi:hypothetical protein